jgi:hypothetical protein
MMICIEVSYQLITQSKNAFKYLFLNLYQQKNCLILKSVWNPAFNEFQLGDSLQNINSQLRTQFSSLTWNDIPQTSEFQYDVVKYFRLN